MNGIAGLDLLVNIAYGQAIAIGWVALVGLALWFTIVLMYE